MYIIGLNVFHGDASACLFKDGKLIAAAEEERFTRIKHAAGFPKESIKFCLHEANISLNEINFIALNRNPKNRIFNKLYYFIRNQLKIKNFVNRYKNLRKILSLEDEFLKHFPNVKNKIRKKIIHVDHHLSHAASSIYSTNLNESNYITIDGFGDFLSTSVGVFKEDKITKINEVEFPHSLGLFYTSVTQFLGFKNYGDEYKVMGLASYGKPTFLEKMSNVVTFDKKKLFKLNLDFFRHHKEGIEMSWIEGTPNINNVFSNNFIETFGKERLENEKITNRHMDIAASAQKLYEIILFKILKNLYDKNQSDNLCLSGGCAMNSVANGKILQNTNYKNIFISHTPNDSGGAIGAAVIVQKKNKIKINISSIKNPYLGNSYDSNYIEKIIKKRETEFEEKKINIIEYDQKKILNEVALNISEQKIVGFFQGRMEFGSRALGNRSILADPRSHEIKNILNSKIKRRESFRPFAPSILLDEVSNWFKVNDQVPYMSKVYEIKDHKREKVPAIVHVDGTGRLQTVTPETNLRFYNLIKIFQKITNVPIILNTSFNENEPIVRTPDQAIDCFLRTNMDVLVLENFVLRR